MKAENATFVTTNHHVPYLALMSKIPAINIITYSFRYKGRDWQQIYREKPKNILHLPIDEPAVLDFMLQLAVSGKKIIMQSLDDLNIFCDNKSPMYQKLQPIPKIMVIHNSCQTEFGFLPPEEKQSRIQKICTMFMQNNIRPVFISKFKQESWQMDGDIILPGIDTDEFVNCWTGRNNKIAFNDKYDNFALRICSNYEHRDFMNGYKIGNNVLSQLKQPNVVLGEGNNTIKERIPNTVFAISNNLENYKDYLSMARFLFSANIDKYEDWYNLSSLEAIATGTPVLMTYHDKQSLIPDFPKYFPITTDDYSLLITEARKLMQDWDYANYISGLQRGFINKYFSLSKFISRWMEILK